MVNKYIFQPSTTEKPVNEEKVKCIEGWTEWINQDRQIFSVKETRKPTDTEPLPDMLILVITFYYSNFITKTTNFYLLEHNEKFSKM